jgi:T-complex protein 1 subunit theta
LDAVKADIYDIVAAKFWALKLAADTAITILRVDQVSH